MYKSEGPEVARGGADVRVVVGESRFHFSRFRFDVVFRGQICMIDIVVFISRIDMRLGPPKSIFWDPGVVLGASSIEMQKPISTGVRFSCACYVNDFSLPN